jgi:hypothetical protein
LGIPNIRVALAALMTLHYRRSRASKKKRCLCSFPSRTVVLDALVEAILLSYCSFGADPHNGTFNIYSLGVAAAAASESGTVSCLAPGSGGPKLRSWYPAPSNVAKSTHSHTSRAHHGKRQNACLSVFCRYPAVSRNSSANLTTELTAKKTNTTSRPGSRRS